MESKKLVAFKGFNSDMTCRGFQYKEGEKYETKNAILCNEGFHACENPIDCFKYYSPANSVFHKVELENVSDKKDNDTKRVAKKIKIGAKLDIAEICKLTFDYVKEHCTNENNAENPGEPVTAGENGAATAGSFGAATAGSYGAATSRGSSSTGKNGLSVARGNNVKVKGGIGAVLVIVEENSNDFGIKEWGSVVVDGKDIKADTWYRLENGKFVEINEDKE